jgi:hypothetical protein
MNYVIWSIRMEVYLQALEYDVRQSIVTGYTPSKTPPTNVAAKEASENNTIAMNDILSGLLDSKKVKMAQCTLVKELWDKLQDLYTKEYEDNQKSDTEKENPAQKEAALKTSKKTRTKEYKTSDNSDNESNVEEANFARKPKRGSGKYKGWPLFKCLYCGEVGHFVAKCPCAKEDSIFKNYKNDKSEKRVNSYRQRKNLYTNEDNSSYDDSDSETEDFIFTTLETQSDEPKNKSTDLRECGNHEIEVEEDLEAELISALEEIDRLEEKNRKQEKELQKYEEEEHDLEETKKTVIILKTQLEEAKRIKEVARSQLKEMEENCEKLKAEIVSLKKELEKTTDHLNRSLKFAKSTKTLDNILGCQRSPFIKIGLGYDNNQKTLEEYPSPKSSEKKIEERPESYANVLKGSNHSEDTARKEIKTNKRLIFHSRKIRMSLEELVHQEDPSQLGIKIFFSVIAFLAKILVTRQ